MIVVIFVWSNLTLPLIPLLYKIIIHDAGHLDELRLMMKEALTFNPRDDALHYNYASALGKAGLLAESEAYFLKAVEMAPNVAKYHTNIG